MSGDPINGFDLSGFKQRALPQELDAPCFYRGPVYDDVLFASPICQHYRVAYYTLIAEPGGDPSGRDCCALT